MAKVFDLCFLWPPTFVDLRWLAMTCKLALAELKFICKSTGWHSFFTVMPPNAGQHKLITSQLYSICVTFMTFCVTLHDSIPYASSDFSNLCRLASPFGHSLTHHLHHTWIISFMLQIFKNPCLRTQDNYDGWNLWLRGVEKKKLFVNFQCSEFVCFWSLK